MVVLEELEHAQQRGATIYGEIARLRLDGRRLSHHRHASRRPRRDALHQAWRWTTRGSNPNDIHYINAHGTSTEVNDKVETLAIKTRLRRAGLQDPGLEHQEHDGPPDRRGRAPRS